MTEYDDDEKTTWPVVIVEIAAFILFVTIGGPALKEWHDNRQVIEMKPYAELTEKKDG